MSAMAMWRQQPRRLGSGQSKSLISCGTTSFKARVAGANPAALTRFSTAFCEPKPGNICIPDLDNSPFDRFTFPVTHCNQAFGMGIAPPTTRRWSGARIVCTQNHLGRTLQSGGEGNRFREAARSGGGARSRAQAAEAFRALKTHKKGRRISPLQPTLSASNASRFHAIGSAEFTNGFRKIIAHRASDRLSWEAYQCLPVDHIFSLLCVAGGDSSSALHPKSTP
jgi:hypothetical protein